MRLIGWLLIFVGFGLLFPRKHYIAGPTIMAIGGLLALI